MKRFTVLCLLAVSLTACQSTSPQDYTPDRDCVQRKAGSKILSKITGVGLGVAGIPGGGLVGRGVAMATDPRCEAFVLTDEARKRLAREQREASPVIRPMIQPATQEIVPNTVYRR